MDQTLFSQSSPVTAQPSRKRKRRLFSKRTKPSSHTRRLLYRSPVFSLKVNHLPSLLVDKKKPYIFFYYDTLAVIEESMQL
uniref:Uncharacterized protein n=1 Tax=Medicago truncatula TaxID=3880 RepID=A2Q351_MEDTR|nr:hypothetical protein MtrDRAFT_AC154867g38v2 [Medicago truncatula]